MELTYETSLAIFSRAALMLAEADTIQKTKELKDLALTAADWAKRKGMGEEAVRYARSYALEAERKMGQLLAETERNPGTQLAGTNLGGYIMLPPTNTPTLTQLGLTKRESSEAQRLAALPEELFEAVKVGDKKLTQAYLEVKRREPKPISPPLPTGTFATIVIDPPWPVEKILRDVRPNQIEFDYPVMPLTEIMALTVPSAENCHLYLWTTQRFLPNAFECLKALGFSYVFTMVWHKSGGFQPYGLPQYNCEFCLFGRKGTLPFADTKDFACCFSGDRREHSRKPETFYQTVARVSPGPRLDMFSRETHEGFERWGNEPAKF